MKKRGQVTTFMIVGLVLLIIFVLIFFLRDSLFEGIRGVEGTKMILSSQLEEINHKMDDCITKQSTEVLNLMAKQGGSVNPVNYRFYYGDKISYLCFNIPGTKKCVSNGLSITELQNELNNNLKDVIKNCINIDSFRDDRRYEMIIGDFNFNSIILEKTVLFNISYPVTLKRKDVELNSLGVSKTINVPLAKIQQTVLDILNIESQTGDFDNVMYTLSKRNEIKVIKKRPSPDKIFIITYQDNPYQFQFAIKG